MTTAPRRIDGVDLSHHNPVTLEGLRKAKAAGARFVYHKATEGDSYTDPTYDDRRKLAARAGLPFGAYHFARPEVGDAAAEATRFLKVAAPRPGDLIPCLDLETTEGLTKAQLDTWAATFARVIRRALGVEAVIYCPWDTGLPGLRWRPRYNDDNRPPALPWDLWQFSNGQLGIPDTIAGLGRVDLNTFAQGTRLDDLLLPDNEDLEATKVIRFVTQNVQALPLMPQGDVVEDVELTARQADVIGWQEIGPDRYDAAVKALGKPWRHYFAGKAGAAGYESPISFRADRFKLVDGDSERIVPPRAKVSHGRYVTWVRLKDRATGLEFLVTNLHMIAGAWNDNPKPFKDERPDWWEADRDRFVSWIEHAILNNPDLPVVNLGDYNSRVAREPALGERISGRRVQYLAPDRSIDHIALIGAGKGGPKVEVVKADETLGGRNSDHVGRRARLRLIERPAR